MAGLNSGAMGFSTGAGLSRNAGLWSGAAGLQGGNQTDWIFTSGSLDSRITFTRASSGTYFDSAGVMQTVTTDVPRFNYAYNGSSWVAKGLLIEPAATNLLLRSREFDHASWAKTDTTITADSINGVGGTATMDLCTEGSGGGALIVQNAVIAANSTNTFAIDLKRGNHDWVRLIFYETTTSSNNVSGYFNLATGAVGTVASGGTGSGATASIRNLGNGIYRCILTGAVNNSATAIQVRTHSTIADNNVTRVSGGTRYQDRAQLESGSVATSFIETTSATATRAADVASITGSNFSSWFNPVEGTFVFEGDISTSSYAAGHGMMDINGGSSANYIRLSRDNANGKLKTAVVTSSVLEANLVSAAAWGGSAQKTAFAYKLNDVAASYGGATAVTDGAVALPSLDRMVLGQFQGSTVHLNGHIARITYYPTRLSDAQLVTLST